MSYENDNDIIAIAIVSLCWHRRICLAIVSLNAELYSDCIADLIATLSMARRSDKIAFRDMRNSFSPARLNLRSSIWCSCTPEKSQKKIKNHKQFQQPT